MSGRTYISDYLVAARTRNMRPSCVETHWSHLGQRGGDQEVWRVPGTHCMVALEQRRDSHKMWRGFGTHWSHLYQRGSDQERLRGGGTQCPKLSVHPAPGVHILAAGCMIFKGVFAAGAPFFKHFLQVKLDVHVYKAGCMVFTGYAPGACMISNINVKHWGLNGRIYRTKGQQPGKIESFSI